MGVLRGCIDSPNGLGVIRGAAELALPVRERRPLEGEAPKALRGWAYILIGITTYLNCSSSGKVINAEALASGITDQITSSVLMLDSTSSR